MNGNVWLKRLLTVGAGLEGLAGLGLLVAPSALVALLLGSALEANGIVVARLAGGGLLGLGVACWSARNTPSAPAALGVAWAFSTTTLLLAWCLLERVWWCRRADC